MIDAPSTGLPSIKEMTMKLENKTQVTVQVDDEDLEDIRIIAARRGQTLSEFIRRCLHTEMAREAGREVTP